MTGDDLTLLRLLIEDVRTLASKATTGVQLIATGEVWDALEKWQQADVVEVDAELTLGFRRGDSQYEEGLFASIRVNEDAVSLDWMRTSYSKDVGSDNETGTHAKLTQDYGFDRRGFAEWQELLSLIYASDDAKLTVSRDHA